MSTESLGRADRRGAADRLSSDTEESPSHLLVFINDVSSSSAGQNVAADLEVKGHRHPHLQPLHPAATRNQHHGETSSTYQFTEKLPVDITSVNIYCIQHCLV